ncbi:UNVERIFIED_CONTAM: hypothetical protein FKN15_024423 [Acipenser sinensis]
MKRTVNGDKYTETNHCSCSNVKPAGRQKTYEACSVKSTQGVNATPYITQHYKDTDSGVASFPYTEPTKGVGVFIAIERFYFCHNKEPTNS